MPKRIDITGRKFGKVTVINLHGKRGKYLYWNVKCDCGKPFQICSTNLLNNKTKSCGCLRNESASKRWKGRVPSNKLEEGEGSMSCLINSYRFGAKTRNLIFELTREEFGWLTKGLCFYCGLPPSTYIKGHRSNGPYIYNGIDRINSSEGYTYANCVSCCEQCNKAKLDRPASQFLNWIERLANHLLSTGDIQLEESVYKKLEIDNI